MSDRTPTARQSTVDARRISVPVAVMIAVVCTVVGGSSGLGVAYGVLASRQDQAIEVLGHVQMTVQQHDQQISAHNERLRQAERDRDRISAEQIRTSQKIDQLRAEMTSRLDEILRQVRNREDP